MACRGSRAGAATAHDCSWAHSPPERTRRQHPARAPQSQGSHPHAYSFPKPHQRLNAFPRALKKIVGWAPCARFAEHDNGRSAEAKHRFFLAAAKRKLERMSLIDSSNRQGSDLHESEASEVGGLQDVYVALVAEENVVLVLQGVSIHRPKPAADTTVIQRIAVVAVVHVVVVDRSQPYEEYGAADERSRALSIA